MLLFLCCHFCPDLLDKVGMFDFLTWSEASLSARRCFDVSKHKGEKERRKFIISSIYEVDDNANIIRTRAEDPIVWSGGSAAEQGSHSNVDFQDQDMREVIQHKYISSSVILYGPYS